jgi:hypothetical protein
MNNYHYTHSLYYSVDGTPAVETYYENAINHCVDPMTGEFYAGDEVPAAFHDFANLLDPNRLLAIQTWEISGVLIFGAMDEGHAFTVPLYQHLATIDPDVVVTCEWRGEDWCDFGLIRLARTAGAATVQCVDQTDCGLPADYAERAELDSDEVERVFGQLAAYVEAAPTKSLAEFCRQEWIDLAAPGVAA